MKADILRMHDSSDYDSEEDDDIINPNYLQQITGLKPNEPTLNKVPKKIIQSEEPEDEPDLLQPKMKYVQ